MTALNAEIPTELMDRLKVAKIVVRQPVRLIVAEAIDAWLKSNGITSDKLSLERFRHLGAADAARKPAKR